MMMMMMMIMIIIIMDFKEKGLRMWTGFNLFTVRSVDGLLNIEMKLLVP
jgi:hypothetical protein